ncbi:MAG: sensor domain-containing diguanylate cyclase [bacterium]
MLQAKIVLSVLLGLTQKFTSDESLEDILQEVTDAALRLLPGNHASLRVFNDARTELLCGARSGDGADERPMMFRPGEGVLGWVAENGWLAYIRDTASDTRFKLGAAQGFDVRSIVAVPLLSAGKVVGVLAVSSDRVDAFTAEDEALSLLLANCTVPIIEKARLERLALVDELTLVYNDRYLLPRLRDEVERAGRTQSPLSLLMLDADNLKELNHSHSFSAGDRMLQRIADRMRALSPPTFRLVRRGGGTFVVIMPQTGQAAAVKHAETIRSDIAKQPISVGEGVTVSQTISIGVAHWDVSERALELLQRADKAMRDAKAAGRNQSVLSEPPDPGSA